MFVHQNNDIPSFLLLWTLLMIANRGCLPAVGQRLIVVYLFFE